MGCIWSGDISTNGQDASIKSLQISSLQKAQKPLFDQHAKVRFLSIVEVALIPLCLAIGPSLDIATDDQATQAWLANIVSHQNGETVENGVVIEPWWERPYKQSERGVLLKVDVGRKETEPVQQVTELLVYATVDPQVGSLPTPPVSSSPGPVQDDELDPLQPSAPPTFKFLALPLCSGILQGISSRASLRDGVEEGQAWFLPRIVKDQNVSTKRRKISSLFDDAAKQRQNRKKKGGESVARAMASIDRPTPETALTHPPQDIESTVDQTTNKPTGLRQTLARASSDGYLTSRSDAARPLSRGKRSSLHRVESAYSPHDDSQTPQSDNDRMLEQNKAAVSKLVMAGMRLHGLQQRQKPSKQMRSRSSSVVAEPALESNAEHEYKLVYHQTFKAAMFAFRKHSNSMLIDQEIMREMVDRLLDMFCTDPFSLRQESGGFPFGNNETVTVQENAFDPPTSSAQNADGNSHWTTPPIKKRKPTNRLTEPG